MTSSEPISASIVYELVQDVDRRNEERHVRLRESIDSLSLQLARSAEASAVTSLGYNGRLIAIETKLSERKEVTHGRLTMLVAGISSAILIVWEIVKRAVGWHQ